MSKFVVAMFPDEAKAYEALHALEELHAEGSVTLYGTIVIQREANGEISIKQRTDQAILRTGLGALAGGLIGLFGGPAGVVVGLTAGGLAGGWYDYLHGEVSDELLEDLGKELVPASSRWSPRCPKTGTPRSMRGWMRSGVRSCESSERTSSTS